MNELTPEVLRTKTLSEIARIIRKDWKPVHFSAVPYVTALMSLETMQDNYGYDSAQNIVAYFLGNAGTWRGEVARMVKKELNLRLKGK